MAPISLNSQNPALQLQITLAKPGLRDGEPTFSHILETQDAPVHPTEPQANPVKAQKAEPLSASRTAHLPEPQPKAAKSQADAPTSRTAAPADRAARRENAPSTASADRADAAARANAARSDAADVRRSNAATANSKHADDLRADAQDAQRAAADVRAGTQPADAPTPDATRTATASRTADARQAGSIGDDGVAVVDTSAGQSVANDAPQDAELAKRLAAIDDKIAKLLAAGADPNEIADALTQAIADALAAAKSGDAIMADSTGGKSEKTNLKTSAAGMLADLLDSAPADGRSAVSATTMATLRDVIGDRLQTAMHDTTSPDATQIDTSRLLADITQFFSRLQRRPDDGGDPPPDVGPNAGTKTEDDNGIRLDADSAKVHSTGSTDALLAQLAAFLNGAPLAGPSNPVVFPPAPAGQQSSAPDTASTQPISISDGGLRAFQVPVQSTAAHAALGLTDDAKTKSGGTDAPPPGDDVLRVRTELPRAGTFAQSDVLLRSLERAANSATVRETIDDPQLRALGKIEDALDRLSAKIAPPAAVVTAATGTPQGGDTAMNYGSFARFADGTVALGQANGTPTGTAAPQSFSASVHGSDPHDVMGQIVSGIRIGEIGSTSDIRLTLTPQHLGEVSVRLRVGADHSVTAIVMADSAEARQAIVQSGDQLKTALAQAGLNLASLDVNVANRDTPRQAFEDKPQARRGAPGAIAAKSGPDEEAPHVYGPSMLDRVNLQLLNQLV